MNSTIVGVLRNTKGLVLVLVLVLRFVKILGSPAQHPLQPLVLQNDEHAINYANEGMSRHDKYNIMVNHLAAIFRLEWCSTMIRKQYRWRSEN